MNAVSLDVSLDPIPILTTISNSRRLRIAALQFLSSSGYSSRKYGTKDCTKINRHIHYLANVFSVALAIPHFEPACLACDLIDSRHVIYSGRPRKVSHGSLLSYGSMQSQ